MKCPHQLERDLVADGGRPPGEEPVVLCSQAAAVEGRNVLVGRLRRKFRAQPRLISIINYIND
jgi:hypothetical protein